MKSDNVPEMLKMERAVFFKFLFAVSLLIVSCKNRLTNSKGSGYPNIIYILTDDLGYGDLRSQNQDSKIPTPNMDAIVNDGIHFKDAHSGSAVCTPTRYGILTGRYAFRTGLKSGVLWGYSPSLMDSANVTVASFLKENGYNTACIGKWHLGLNWHRINESEEIPDVKGEENVPPDHIDNVDYKEFVAGGPTDFGFDYSFIIPASLDMSPYCYIRNGKVVEEPTSYTQGKDQNEAGRGVFWRSGKVSPSFNFDEVLPTFVDSATSYISSNANQTDPFFLYLALPSPHTPWLPTREHEKVSEAGKYGDYVAMVDNMIGKILLSLQDNGISENTLVIVTSDNGSDWRPSDKEATGHKANYIFKGRKADIYEAGHRVPFVAKWPGVISPGSVSDEVMCTTDLMATLAGLLGTEAPPSALDSYNMWPAFIGQHQETPIRAYTIHHSLDGYFSIRKGHWKLTPYLGSGGFTNPKRMETSAGGPPGTLYNLKEDIQEQNNLYQDYPQIVEELSALLKPYQEIGQTVIE